VSKPRHQRQFWWHGQASLTNQVLTMIGTGKCRLLVTIPHPIVPLGFYTLRTWASVGRSWREGKTGPTCFTTTYHLPPPPTERGYHIQIPARVAGTIVGAARVHSSYHPYSMRSLEVWRAVSLCAGFWPWKNGANIYCQGRMGYANLGFLSTPLPLPSEMFILETLCDRSQSWVAQALHYDTGHREHTGPSSHC
jgi:hypothetical protein